MTRIELCTDGLSIESREAILEAIYQELRISPGDVSSDGNFELELVDCKQNDPDNAPFLRVNGNLFTRVDATRVRDLVRSKRR